MRIRDLLAQVSTNLVNSKDPALDTNIPEDVWTKMHFWIKIDQTSGVDIRVGQFEWQEAGDLPDLRLRSPSRKDTTKTEAKAFETEDKETLTII